MKKEIIQKKLQKLKAQNNFRKLIIKNSKQINFSSNDYLGCASDPALRKEFFQNNQSTFSASSSRLIDGSYPEVMELEKELEKIYGKPGLVFNSGFTANSAIIKTFYDKKSLIIADRLNHASIYNGIVDSGAKFFRYNHLDLKHLKKILVKNIDRYDDILVISETIYSMDGDICDLLELVRLKKKYHFNLMLDEAHSYGVYGYGLAHQLNVIDDIDFLTIPLGKGGGSMGAYVITSQLAKDFIINKCPEFIYSTAIPPINNAWNLFILKKMVSFTDKQQKLQELTKHFLSILSEYGIQTTSSSHIISIIVGDNQKAIQLAKYLQQKGFNIHAIKEPTVPQNTARIRVSLHSNLQKSDLLRFVQELKNAATIF
ncbi:MAG: aminotransferase class I/II-fold pyridoxal phosphate-dependent enzyme [Lactobacillales bacterium]|jgi:8-amino-7-oxononanoate synthase|nr:aminotransferase class I/II-fold pyridoxal phosphate-dependent enzyme [Lactobacillales bacterium]